MKTRNLLIAGILFFAFFTACQQPLDKQDFITDCEKSGFTQTPRYAETLEYCRLLAANSSKIHFTTIGTSPQGREIPLLIVDKNGYTDAAKVRQSGRAVVLAEACIHAGEPDGKDAGLMFIRDIALFDELPGLLDSVTLLFIPILNVDGHEDFGEHYRINQNGPIEVGARATKQNYNMNRDFVKADAPETRALLKLYNEWMPEIFIDFHVTNGADFQYVSTYGLPNSEFLTANMLEWSNNVFEKELTRRMEQDGFPIFPYFYPVRGFDKKEAIASDFAPQYSNGYASANNRIGLLVENHIYKPYKDRVAISYLYLKNALGIAAERSTELQREIAAADRFVSSPEFRMDSLTLSYRVDYDNPARVPFLGWKEITVTSDLSGGQWRYFDYDSPVTEEYALYNSFIPEKQVKLPEAYIIPQEQMETIALLDVHGISYSLLEKETEMEVESYRFTRAEWSDVPYEGRITLNAEYDVVRETLQYHTGDVIVSTSQPKVHLVAHMLEPKSPTSLLYWGFFNNFIQAPNEFWISLPYMEVKGREMLERDPALRAEFEARKTNDPAFAKDPNTILNFFMTKVRASVERGSNRYPVGRIMTATNS